MSEGQLQIPVAAEVDVVVVGGSTWAVAAALTARRAGAEVFLAAPRPYLGEDLCATLRLELEDGRDSETELAERIFDGERATTPLRVKQVLDEAVWKAGVRVVFGCFATEVLRDADNAVCGVVLADRAGRQAVPAKVVIDATRQGSLAAIGGAVRREGDTQAVACERTVLLPNAGGADAGAPAGPVRDDVARAQVVRHKLTLPLGDGGPAAMAAAEQEARDRTCTPGQLRAAESLFFVPPRAIVCEAPPESWTGPDDADLGHFRPAGLERVYVLSGAADVPRDAAAELLRPTGLMKLAERVGEAAAAEAGRIDRPADPRVADVPDPEADAQRDWSVRELLAGLRPWERPERTVPARPSAPPVLGRYDVVVVGGGTSGAAAAIAAARRGARVLVLEYQEGLGGTGTVGLIGKPYHGLRRGFSEEVPFTNAGHTLEEKMEWYRRQIRDARGASGEIWLGVLACGTAVRGETVCGVVVTGEQGRGVVLADVVIDATGNADVAAAAGATCFTGAVEDDQVAWQGAGLAPWPLGCPSYNTDYLLLDESDLIDATRALIGARATMRDAFDAGPLLQTRERRRVVGEHVLTYLDQVVGRTYPDTVAVSASDYDTHGYPNHPYFSLLPHDADTRGQKHPAPGGVCYTPYRCLLPRGLDGMLVIGLGISMERDASALVRMQYDLANQGYAAGVAAAMAARGGVGVRDVDLRALQRHLVEIGCLPEEVLDHEDNYPFSDQAVREAVGRIVTGSREEACRALAIVLTHLEQALEPLREAFRTAEGEARAYPEDVHGPGGAKLAYARILGTLGDPCGLDRLIDALQAASWDEKIFQGKMAEYGHLPTPVDSLILSIASALRGAAAQPDGATEVAEATRRRARAAILEKVEQLDADSTLSHHRAVAAALERMSRSDSPPQEAAGGTPRGHKAVETPSPDSEAAEALARLLARPGMSGHAMTEIEPLHDKPPEKRRREPALRELILARALYRCGDHDERGERTLRTYTHDLRSVLAAHAADALEAARRASC